MKRFQLSVLVVFGLTWLCIAPTTRAAEGPMAQLPAHLAESGIPTQGEIDLVGAWLKTILPDQPGKRSAEAWVDGWIGTGLPFEIVVDAFE